MFVMKLHRAGFDVNSIVKLDGLNWVLTVLNLFGGAPKKLFEILRLPSTSNEHAKDHPSITINKTASWVVGLMLAGFVLVQVG